jgi:hypothetical protein
MRIVAPTGVSLMVRPDTRTQYVEHNCVFSSKVPVKRNIQILFREPHWHIAINNRELMEKTKTR